ncbi:MAG: CapA family protein [Ignavibacteria bacterium]|nr:CapA family protein [Ignavibacteria bacterium]
MFKIWALISIVYISTLFQLLSSDNNVSQFTITNSDSIKTINILCVGDLMCHKPQAEGAYIDSLKSYDFNPSFRFVRELLSSGDIVIGNFETVTAGGAYSGYPLFNSPDEFLHAIKNAGFNVLVTSNNHCLDRGEKGLIRTANLIDDLGITRVGTFLSSNDRDSIRVLKIADFQIAVLAYTYGTNGVRLPEAKSYLVNQINDNQISSDINRCKILGVDLVLVYFHFGDEYQLYPNSWQKSIVEKTFSLGADIIISSHPHVIQPLELIELGDESKLDTGLVAFSLGNFISNQRGRFKQAGVILEIELEKNLVTNTSRISLVKSHPTWVHIERINAKTSHVIIPLTSYNKELYSKQDLSLMEQARSDTWNQLSGEHKILSNKKSSGGTKSPD